MGRPLRDPRRCPRFVAGAGTMGPVVSRPLLQVDMTVWNRSTQPAVALAELSATAFYDPRDAVVDASVY